MAQAKQRKKASTPSLASAIDQKAAPAKAARKAPKKGTATRKLATATKKAAAPKATAKRAKATTVKAKRPTNKTAASIAAKSPRTKVVKAAPAAARKAKAPTAPPAVTAKRKHPAKRARNVVLQVSPVAIDTTAAAAVAANLVLQHTHPVDAPHAAAHSATLIGVKRGSSAFRHAKESAANPVAKQLAHVFGPAPLVQGLLPKSFRNDRPSRGRKVTSTYNPHAGYLGVPRRAAG